jgi:hypothetical protein
LLCVPTSSALAIESRASAGVAATFGVEHESEWRCVVRLKTLRGFKALGGMDSQGLAENLVDADGNLHTYCHEKVIGDIDNRQDGGLVDYSEYWVDRPESAGGGSTGTGGGGGEGPPKKQF